MWHISVLDHAHKGEPCFCRFLNSVENAWNANIALFFKPLLICNGLTKHTCSFTAMSCIPSFSSRTEQTWELLQPLWTLSNSTGAVPSTDALFKGICVVAAERGENVFSDFSKQWNPLLYHDKPTSPKFGLLCAAQWVFLHWSKTVNTMLNGPGWLSPETW